MHEWIRANLLIVRVGDERALSTERGQAQALALVPEYARRGHRVFIFDGILHRDGIWAIFRVPKEIRRERLSRGRGGHV